MAGSGRCGYVAGDRTGVDPEVDMVLPALLQMLLINRRLSAQLALRT